MNLSAIDVVVGLAAGAAAGVAREDQVIVFLGASVGLLFVAPILRTTLDA